MHALVDVDTGLILALSVTDDRVGDSTMFESFVDWALESVGNIRDGRKDGREGISVYGDGAYASRKIHRACGERSIDSLIRLRVSSTAKGRESGDLWPEGARPAWRLA